MVQYHSFWPFVCSPFASQHSDIIILELGTINDLSFLSPEAVGSRLEDLVALLRDNLHVSVVSLCIR
jgi:hypothetical protein